MPKILFVASVQGHFSSFHIPYMKWFKDNDWEVHCACKVNPDKSLPYCDRIWDVPFVRSPYQKGHLKAFKELKHVIDSGNYDIVHCHTPMASVLTRLAAKNARKNGTKVLYTAHGFHFFKGGPKSGWLIYFPVEKLLSSLTDAIITINHEDYEATWKYKFNCPTYLVPGVGLDTSRFIVSSPELRAELRNKYGIPEEKYILFYAAEFIPRKNQEYLIRQIPELSKVIPEITLMLAGDGRQVDEMRNLVVQLKMEDHVKILGFRRDCPQLTALSDVGVSASRQEGLGINVAEYMFAGLPVVISHDRGHHEMVTDGKDGFYFPLNQNDTTFREKIIKLYNDPQLRKEMGAAAKKSIEKFSIDNALKAHIPIYRSLMP